MDGVAVTTPRGHAIAAVVDFFQPGFGLVAVADEVVERTMNVVGIAAGANLHGFKAKGGDLVEHGVESEMLVNGIEDADGNLALVARGPRPGRGGGPGFGCTGRKDRKSVV